MQGNEAIPIAPVDRLVGFQDLNRGKLLERTDRSGTNAPLYGDIWFAPLVSFIYYPIEQSF
jgi:hypothetical protein